MESDDPLDEYFAGIRNAATSITNGTFGVEDFLCSSDPDDSVRRLVRTRSELATDDECESIEPFLTLYRLDAWPETQRSAVLLVWNDIVSACSRLDAKRECETYCENQPVFKSSPAISSRIDWSNPPELMPIQDLPWVDDDGIHIVANDDEWCRPSGMLRDELIKYLRGLSSTCDVMIRLDPFSLSPAGEVNLQEAIARQADPHWWRTLAIHPGETKYSEYVLDEGGALWEQVEFRNGLRRLEAAFLRRNSGHLMSSVEELAFDAPDLVAGLLLHSDSADPIGTDWADAVLGHIDGAINVYSGEAAQRRFDQRHAHGKVINATARTHLFRIDGAPVRITTELAQLFFRSKFLVQDWLHDQFGD